MLVKNFVRGGLLTTLAPPSLACLGQRAFLILQAFQSLVALRSSSRRWVSLHLLRSWQDAGRDGTVEVQPKKSLVRIRSGRENTGRVEITTAISKKEGRMVEVQTQDKRLK